MSKENVEVILWDECKELFMSAYDQTLNELVKKIIKIIKKNYDVFYEKADLEFLDFIVELNVDEYLVGTSGNDFGVILRRYSQQNITTIEKIWEILAQLLWDLIIPVTDKICPFCQCDNLVLLVDKKEQNIYESCENCFWISKDNIQIRRPDFLFPANRALFLKRNYRPLM